jgi:hypothetical protein
LRKPDLIPPQVWNYLHWAQLGAFVLSVVGAAGSYQGLVRAAVVIWTVMFIGQSIITITFASRSQDTFHYIRQLMEILIYSIPFLVIRMTYALLTTFSLGASPFAGDRPNVVAQSLMQYLMEFATITLFLWAGITLKRHGHQRLPEVAENPS